MKNLVIKISLVVFIFAIGIIACKKETPTATDQVNKYQLSGNNLQLINNLTQFEAKNSNERAPTTGQVVVADLLGALEGGAKGFEWSGGNPWITGIGAVLVGAATSYVASGIVQNPGEVGGTGTGNPGNPYDFVGVQHNADLSIGFAGFNCPGNCNEAVYTQSENYTATHLDPIALQLRPALQPSANQLFDLLPLMPGSTNEDFIALVASQGLVNPIQAAVATEYAQNILPLPTEEFAQASIDFENTVLNSNISVQDKTVILMGLSVARHSRGYWNVN
jgi:hypothetical protein